MNLTVFQPFKSLLIVGLLWPMTGFTQSLDLSRFESMKARNIGPAGMSGRVTAIDVVESNPQIMLVGTASGGLWKSESGGVSWESIFDEQPVASIGAVDIFQRNPDIIWVGTGEGNPRNSQTSGAGVFRSLDGGRSWKCMGLENTRNIHRVIIHPENPETVYVGAQGSAWGSHPERGVFKTTDGGKTWEHILSINDSTGVGDMVMDPHNPNKLFVAMWEFRRWPWYFTSGGQGSGLYVTFDGGEHWTQRTEKDGLPEGDLGRIGLAIARSNHKVVYALVEAKENALYRSADGGFTFKKVGTGEGIGNRPFYYADIIVDPANENRIYSLHSIVTRSEDGGKSFETLLGYVGSAGVHPDHHYLWIHPENHQFLINGNDGGMAISHDMGATWRFVENLPLAQYYHINVDNEWPYNVYGGMQDNGSWRGPGYVWRAGGIRNSYWEELSFGDGFDVVPDPSDHRYGYSMSQEGYVGRYDFNVGDSRMIRPVHPDGIPLRFNWNAGIAQDPFDESTIYFGSQFLHKSEDHGETWTIISPDLTTNDSSKQQQATSGGLTYDVTGAENHTSILAIEPSELDRELLWVGTDDGNLQRSTDGAESWTNLADRLPGLPDGSWIPQIHASVHDRNEVFVIANNYRRNDWTPFLFYSDDLGETWKNLADDGEVWGYCLSFHQDRESPNLMFLGTEFGLHVSVDRGQHWAKWTHGFPTVSTMDLTVQEREKDLVVGTFGRSAFVLDDIRPLQAIAADPSVLDESLTIFQPPTGVLARYRQPSGGRFLADAAYKGENRPVGAPVSLYIQPFELDSATTLPDMPDYVAGKDTLTLAIYDETGVHIRSLYHQPDTGLNKVYWYLNRKGVWGPMRRGLDGQRMEPSGADVIPGTYRIVAHYQGLTDTTSMDVVMDPRLDLDVDALLAYEPLLARRDTLSVELFRVSTSIREAKKDLDLLSKLIPEGDDTMSERKDSLASVKKQVTQLEEELFGPAESKGYTDDSHTIQSQLSRLYRYLQPENIKPSGTAIILLDEVEETVSKYLDKADQFFSEEWQEFRELVEAVDWEILSEFE